MDPARSYDQKAAVGGPTSHVCPHGKGEGDTRACRVRSTVCDRQGSGRNAASRFHSASAGFRDEFFRFNAQLRDIASDFIFVIKASSTKMVFMLVPLFQVMCACVPLP